MSLYKSVVAASIALSAAPAIAQGAPVMAPPAPVAELPETAKGWSIQKDTGTCVLQKGADGEPQISLTTRGRMMISAPAFADPAFVEGQNAVLTLRWSDGRVEQVEAATIVLPGGGPQKLRARQAYIIPYDTVGLAKSASNGFALTVERAETLVWTMNTWGSMDAMRQFVDCADAVMIRTVKPPVVEQKRRR